MRTQEWNLVTREAAHRTESPGRYFGSRSRQSAIVSKAISTGLPVDSFRNKVSTAPSTPCASKFYSSNTGRIIRFKARSAA